MNGVGGDLISARGKAREREAERKKKKL